jgi:hypothetical protein
MIEAPLRLFLDDLEQVGICRWPHPETDALPSGLGAFIALKQAFNVIQNFSGT